MVEIGEAYAGQTVDVRVGQVIELRLKENPTTGFRWQFERDGEPACRIKTDFVEPADTSKPVRMGQGATHVWQIEGAQVGTCDLSLSYGRPWEDKGVTMTTFDVRIHVTN